MNEVFTGVLIFVIGAGVVAQVAINIQLLMLTREHHTVLQQRGFLK